MASQNLVNTVSGNGLLYGGTKPLPEPILTNYKQRFVVFTWIQFYRECLRYQSLIWVWKLLTHWGRVTHICVGNLAIIGSDNGLSPGRSQAIIWTDAGILLIGPLGTNFSEIWIGIQTFSLKKIHLKMSSAKWCLLCLGLNVLIQDYSGISQGAMTWLVNDGVSYVNWCVWLRQIEWMLSINKMASNVQNSHDNTH